MQAEGRCTSGATRSDCWLAICIGPCLSASSWGLRTSRNERSSDKARLLHAVLAMPNMKKVDLIIHDDACHLEESVSCFRCYIAFALLGLLVVTLTCSSTSCAGVYQEA